jgi:hypothetical protein
MKSQETGFPFGRRGSPGRWPWDGKLGLAFPNLTGAEPIEPGEMLICCPMKGAEL